MLVLCLYVSVFSGDVGRVSYGPTRGRWRVRDGVSARALAAHRLRTAVDCCRALEMVVCVFGAIRVRMWRWRRGGWGVLRMFARAAANCFGRARGGLFVLQTPRVAAWHVSKFVSVAMLVRVVVRPST